MSMINVDVTSPEQLMLLNSEPRSQGGKPPPWHRESPLLFIREETEVTHRRGSLTAKFENPVFTITRPQSERNLCLCFVDDDGHRINHLQVHFQGLRPQEAAILLAFQAGYG
jgi:hypothetical protein